MRGIARCNFLLLWIAAAHAFGYHDDMISLGVRRVEVYSDTDLVAALLDETIDRIVLMRDIRLGPEWDNQNNFPLHIRRNVTIKSSLEAAAFASLDFRYLSGKLRLEPGVWLSIFRLRLRGLTASHAPSFPFVATSPNSHVLFQDCLLHRTSCVPIELVYSSIKAQPPPMGTFSPTAGASGAGPPLPSATAAAAVPPPAAFASDIELLRRFCFRTARGRRECRPLALWLRKYAYETRRRATGALGTGGFVLHAFNTTLVCDHPISETCMRDSGPEFCVSREITRRQRQERWRRGAGLTVLATACTAAALAAGLWLLHRQAAAAVTAAATVGSTAGWTPYGAAVAPSAAATLQWLAGLSAGAEAEAEAAAAATAGIPLRRPLIQLPSAKNATSGAAAAADGVFATPTASRASTRTLDHSASGVPGTRTGSTGSTSTTTGGGGGTATAAAACGDYPPAITAAAASAAGQDDPAATSGHGGLRLPAPQQQLGGAERLHRAAQTAAADVVHRQQHRHHHRHQQQRHPPDDLMTAAPVGPAEVEGVSGGSAESCSSPVMRAAAETQERILHFRQSINSGTGAVGSATAASVITAAAANGGGGDVHDNLEVAELLGSGTFGKVFKGLWHGTPVALKLMVFPAALTGRSQLEQMAAMEAAISSSISHPNIVQTYTWRVTPLLDAIPLQPHQMHQQPPTAAAASSPPPLRTVTAPIPAAAVAAAAAAEVAAAAPKPAAAAGAAGAGVPKEGPEWRIQTQIQTQLEAQPVFYEDQQVQPPQQQQAWGAQPRSKAGPALGAQAAGTAALASPQPRDSQPPTDRLHQKQQQGPGTAGGPLVSSAGAGVLQEGFELCLILELCDGGSLRDLLSRGGFRRAADHGSVDVGALLDVAADVGRAMSYLHARQIVHSDLKSRNVLLKSVSGPPAAQGRRCGLVAKVSDFGLSLRIDDEETHVSNVYQGTTAFMAPEVLLHGRISKASDVYSFGILLWEMYTCAEVFKLVPKALLAAKVVEGMRPDFPPEVPQPYLRLAQACWAADPGNRPSFEQVVRQLGALRSELLGEPPPPPLQPRGSVTAQLRRMSSWSRGGGGPGGSQQGQGQAQAQQGQGQAQAQQGQGQVQAQQGQGQGGGRPPAWAAGVGGAVGSARHVITREVAVQQRTAASWRRAPTLETIVASTSDSVVTVGVEAVDDDGGGGGGLLQRPQQPRRRAPGAAAAVMERVAAASAAADVVEDEEDPAMADEQAAPMWGGGGGGSDASGSSSNFGALRLQRLIESNLLIVGGGEGGSTVAFM